MESKNNLLCKRSLEVIWSYSPAQTMPIYVAIALFGQVAQVLQDPIFFYYCLRRIVSIMVCMVFSIISILSPSAFILNS